MYEQIEKPKENKSRVAASSVAQKKSNVKQGYGFVDKRPVNTIFYNSNKVVQRAPGDFVKLTGKKDWFVVYSAPSNQKPTRGKVTEVQNNAIFIDGKRFGKLAVNGNSGFKLHELSQTEDGLSKRKEIKDGSTYLEDQSPTEKHLGEFHENFHKSKPSKAKNRDIVQSIAEQTPGVKENFTCDQFARELQMSLKNQGVPFQNLLIAIDIKPDPRNDANITLHERGHVYDNQRVGNDSHFVTTIEDDDGIWVFDNHHPQGILLSEFLYSVKFQANIHTQGKIEHVELVNQGMVKVFLMPAVAASKAGGWLKALNEQDPKFGKFYGILMKDFLKEHQNKDGRTFPPGNIELLDFGNLITNQTKLIIEGVESGAIPKLKKLIIKTESMTPDLRGRLLTHGVDVVLT
jgi:hypothetical protein